MSTHMRVARAEPKFTIVQIERDSFPKCPAFPHAVKLWHDFTPATSFQFVANLQLNDGFLKRIRDAAVLVVVTDDATPLGRVATPRLAHSEQTKDFVLEVEMAPDANV